MNARLVLWLLIAIGTCSTGWRAWELLDHDVPVSDLRPGDFPVLPLFLVGICAHVVVFHGSCQGCERLVRGRERALWTSLNPHPRDSLFPHAAYGSELYEALRVNAIPVEFTIRASGEVAHVGNPLSSRAPTCEALDP